MRNLLLATLSMFTITYNIQADVNKVTEVTKESDISQEGYAIVKFYAEWCPPCRAFKTEFEELATKYSNKGNFYAVNVDTQADISSKYEIKSLPTVAILSDGQVVEKVGASQLEEKLKDLKSRNKKVEVKKATPKRTLSVVTEKKTVKKQKKSCADCNCDKK